MMHKKIGFLFGAGAEECFNMPTGARFTSETMLRKRSSLYEALKNYYSSRLPTDYVDEYYSEFMFRENSSAFKEIIRRAAISCNNDPNQLNHIETETMNIIKAANEMDGSNPENEEAEKQFAELVRKAYPEIILEHDGCKEEFEQKYLILKKNFSYYGSVEKDFSTIIAPKEAGIKRFWRLINYIWGAYFSIILPIIENGFDRPIIDLPIKSKYEYVLSNLHDITATIYSVENFLEKYRYKVEHNSTINNYYKEINESAMDVAFAITTNYTPFVNSLNIDKNRIAFLAGELRLFELPQELRVIDISKEDINANDFKFPYLFTQAPLKPIVEPLQIEAYAKAIKALTEIDALVIIGFGLNKDDSHINAILRNYLVSQDKQIVYCKHVDKTNSSSISQTAAVNEVINNLKLKRSNNIKAIIHNGNAKELIRKIKSYV